MKNLLDTFIPISLDEMSDIRLMNRTDTKFVTTLPLLRQLLEMARDSYRVQEIEGNRLANYYTLYFDTPDHAMYLAHHNGRANRQKLRVRAYVDSGLSFLEVKTKNNHLRTNKKRVVAQHFDPLHPDYDYFRRSMTDEWAEENRALIRKQLRGEHLMLPKTENNFQRITLVNNRKTERLTIDLGLKFRNIISDRQITLDNIAIIELKRDGLLHSPILELLRQLRIKPMGFSKYCMSMAMTNEALKQNRFKPRLHAISKMMLLT